MTIGRLARLAGVGVETIRYYQRQGLIAEPAKPLGGIRSYPQESLQRLQFIRRAKRLGFTLEEIKELMSLGLGNCNDTQQLAQRKLHDIHAKVQDLNAMAAALQELLARCHAEGGEQECPLIRTLLER